MAVNGHAWCRTMLAGPGAIVVALVTMAGMTRWLPGGAAGIDNVVLPLVLAPLIWAALFFYACLDPKVSRVAIVSGVLLIVHGALVASAFAGGDATMTEIAR
jgi:hypothetical protein